MPKIPEGFEPDRIVCRTFISCLQPGEYHLKCWDQGGYRFKEADRLFDTREEAAEVGRKWVNRAYSPKVLHS